MSNLLKRALTGAIFVGIIIGAVSLGPESFSILFLLVVLATANEFYDLTLKGEKFILRKILTLASAMLPSIFFALFYNGFSDILPSTFFALYLGLLILLLIAELFSKSTKPFNNLGSSFVSIFYIGGFLSLIFYLGFHAKVYDPVLPLGILMLTWSSDTFAYLTGSAFGKTPLFKRISPKKTIEGSLGGLILTILLSLAFAHYFYDYSILDWILFAIIASVIGTLGDLIESMLKRSLNIKDSGTILPGHGGFLDRFDSFILIVPSVAVYLILKYGF